MRKSAAQKHTLAAQRATDPLSLEAEAVMLSLIARAKRGDAKAAAAFQAHMDRARRAEFNFSGVRTLSAIDDALGKLLDAVARQAMAPAEAAHIATVLRSRGAIIEQLELTERVANAEKAIAEQRAQYR